MVSDSVLSVEMSALRGERSTLVLYTGVSAGECWAVSRWANSPVPESGRVMGRLRWNLWG